MSFSIYHQIKPKLAARQVPRISGVTFLQKSWLNPCNKGFTGYSTSITKSHQFHATLGYSFFWVTLSIVTNCSRSICPFSSTQNVKDPGDSFVWKKLFIGFIDARTLYTHISVYDTLWDIAYVSSPLLSSKISGYKVSLNKFSNKLELKLLERAFKICITLWV